MTSAEPLAKIVWQDPSDQSTREYVLTEGATATIGRSPRNDIHIPEKRVSRQHAVISYRDGLFVITDLGSSNGTFVNEKRIEEPFPLFAGDEVRLYGPVIQFLALQDGDAEAAQQTGSIIVPTAPDGQASLTVTNGAQEGQTIPILLDRVTIGRAVQSATWEVMLQDPSVSRPHARIEKHEGRWYLIDLESSNGTFCNKKPVSPNGMWIKDGDTIMLGGSIMLFRTGWERPPDADDFPATVREAD